MRNEDFILLAFGAIFLFSLIMLLSQGSKFTGYATTATTTSNVTISTYFAISMSANLSDGIRFGNITTLPTTNQNATHNFDGTNTTMSGNGTSFWINVSNDSNTAVDFCLKGDDNLRTSGGDVITLANETYHNNTATNLSVPTMSSEIVMTTSFAKVGGGISGGVQNLYYRFWLDIPTGTAAGTYNNTVSFKGVATGGAC